MINKRDIPSKKHLKMFLENLQIFEKPNFKLEQYPMDSTSAADVLYIAGMEFDDIFDKIIIDTSAGTGILSIGAVLMGAKKVYAVDIDKNAVEIGKRNAKNLEIGDKISWINSDIKDFDIKGDTVIQNPPFGIRSTRHADIKFLKKALSLAGVCYSIHKAVKRNREFLSKYVESLNGTVTNIITLKINIPQLYTFHEKKKLEIFIDLYRIISN